MKKFLLSIFAVMLAVFSVQAQEVTKSVTFSSYTAGTQYAKNEKHDLGDGLVIYTTECHFTSELRIYSSSTHNGYVVSDALPGTITKMTFNAGNKSDKLDIYGSNDGATWTKVGQVSVTSSYKDYSFTFSGSYTRFKLDVAGSNQVRLKSMSVTYTTAGGGGGETVVDVAEPTFTPVSGTTFEEELNITIVAEDGLTVHYSTDNKATYTEGNSLNITETTTVYAYAEDADGNQSDVVSATYTKVELKTIAEVLAAGVIGNAMTRGTVVATYSRGFLLSDGTGYILVYQGSDKGIVAGDFVTVSGATNEYGGLLQFGTSPVVEKTGTAEVVHPNVITMDGAAMDAYLAKSSIQYVEYTGTLTVSGSYYNVAVDGAATALGSIQYPKTNFVVAESGDVVKVTGYTIGVSNSSGSPKYVNTMAVSVEVVEGGATDPEEPETPEIPEEPETPGSVTAPCYVKVTSAPADWSGKYLIVYEDGADAYVFKALESANNYVAATIDNGVILATEELNSVAVELASMNGGYSVKTSAGYISGTNDSNKLNFNKTTAQLNSLEFVDGEGVKITSNTSVFRFNSAKDNLRFRYFKSATFESQKPIQLYKYTEPVAETWSSFYAAMDTQIPAGVEAYIVTAANKDYVTLTQISGTIPAMTGVIFKSNPESNTGSEQLANVEGNLLEGVLMNANKTEEAYVLGCVDGEYGFYKAAMNQQDGTAWLANGGKAYLPVKNLPKNAQGAASFSFRFGEGTTGVDELIEQRAESKVIFDLTGRRVEAITAPGIYIVGGKKVLVK